MQIHRLLAIGIACLTLATSAKVRAAEETDTPPTDTKAKAQTLALGQAYDSIGAGVHQAQVSVKLADSDAVIATATTDELGDFTLTATQAYRGPAVVTVSKPFHQDYVARIELGSSDGPPFIEARMVGDITIAGTVVDAQKSAPIAGAKVLAETGYQDFSVDTDSNGAFRIAGISPGRILVTVEAPGFAKQRIPVEKTQEADPLAIALSPERIVHLKITDDRQQPIAGVDVECLDTAANDYRHLLSDAQGGVTIRGLRFDLSELGVRLSHEQYVSATDFDRTITPPADVNISTHGLIMQPAGIIAGVITDAASRNPVMGARVSAGEVLSDYLPRAWSGLDGAYRIVGVPPGKTVVTVHAAGRAPQLAEVAVEPREETTLDLTLSAARTITGQVVDPEGKPVAHVHVTATRWRGWNTLGLQAMTDTSGAFRIMDAPPDGFEIALYVPEFKPLLDQQLTGERNRFDFALQPDPRKGPGVSGGGPPAGGPAPDFTFTTLAGAKLALADLKGKVILLDFWATWCGPCLGEIPRLQEVHQALGKRDDFVMISVSLDDDAAKLTSFVAAKKMDWHHAVGDAGGASDAVNAYQVSAIPALFVIGPDGKIIASDLRGAQIQRAVEAALPPEK